MRITAGRKKPYTEKGIKRVPCYRCGKPSSKQWQICALNNRWLGVCEECDIRLNQVVLKFMGFIDWPHILQKYEAKLLKERLENVK